LQAAPTGSTATAPASMRRSTSGQLSCAVKAPGDSLFTESRGQQNQGVRVLEIMILP
jgi:hypothetical protein